MGQAPWANSLPATSRTWGHSPDRLALDLGLATPLLQPRRHRARSGVGSDGLQPPGPTPPPGPAPPRPLALPPAGCGRTCRARCRASTKPSAFMPTGALCPCTSSAITTSTTTAAAAAAAAARLPGPASRSAWGPVAGKGKSPHFRRKGRWDAHREESRVCRAGAGQAA